MDRRSDEAFLPTASLRPQRPLNRFASAGNSSASLGCREVGWMHPPQWPRAGGSLRGEKKMFLKSSFVKRPRVARMFNHGCWRLAVGGWRLVVGGGWWLVIGGWWRLAAVGGWRLLAVGGWRSVVPWGGP